MKAVKVALAILIFTVALVLINSFFLSHTVNGYREKVSAINSEDTEKAYSAYLSLYEDFRNSEKYISLTVSHADLMNIEETFSSAIGAAKANNSDELEIIKSRLQDALDHLKRLVGINLDSIL